MKWGIKEKTNLLLGFFVASLILSNILGSKITEFSLPAFLAKPLNIIFFPVVFILNSLLQIIGGREIAIAFFDQIHVSVGILTVPIMFLITDIIEEVHGKEKAREFIIIGVSSLLLVIAVTAIAVFLPSAERSIDNTAYTTIFKVTLRIMFASIVAFVISQFHDVWAFHFWKRKFKGKYLWVRNNLSTIVSQLIDSTIFMFLAFYKTTPMWDAVFVISLIVPYWIFKILFAALDTPAVYAGRWWLRK